jgi:hypothetical protein
MSKKQLKLQALMALLFNDIDKPLSESQFKKMEELKRLANEKVHSAL